MKNKLFKKFIVYAVTLLFIFIVFAPSFNSLSTTKNYKFEMQNLNKSSSDRDWMWIESYPNYVPSGMPDFDQQQKQWKSIIDGGNGLADTNATGDDIQLIAWGSEVGLGEIIIAPGENCQLDTNINGDDVEKWAFCGPTALANSLWWFDSKFANPDGIPGDGEDDFPLVEKYADDDHSDENVPILIEQLARTINTSDKGSTTIEDMNNAIDLWLTNNNLDDRFESTIKDEPTFNFISDEINESKNVIIQLGFYDYEIGDKKVDQSQPSRTFNKRLQTETWWDYQSFTPTVDRLDAIKIPLRSTSTEDCIVEINVYDTEGGDAIGTANLNPGILQNPTWIQFHIEPFVELEPFETYYFDVRQEESGYRYEWFYSSPDSYSGGMGWMNEHPYDTYGIPFDWTFETEFYDPPPGSVRKDGHFVTCAGINFEESIIAISDPLLDINNSADINHNDAKNISHDVYLVEKEYPYSDLDYSVILPIYSDLYDFTIVESVIVIYPLPDKDPPEVEIVRPINSIYLIDNEVYPFILPVIIGFITIEVNATDNREIDSVKFIVNGITKSTDTSKPYKWKWEEGSFFIQTIEIDAVDTSGNHGYDILTLLKFF